MLDEEGYVILCFGAVDAYSGGVVELGENDEAEHRATVLRDTEETSWVHQSIRPIICFNIQDLVIPPDPDNPDIPLSLTARDGFPHGVLHVFS